MYSFSTKPLTIEESVHLMISANEQPLVLINELPAHFVELVEDTSIYVFDVSVSLLKKGNNVIKITATDFNYTDTFFVDGRGDCITIGYGLEPYTVNYGSPYIESPIISSVSPGVIIKGSNNIINIVGYNFGLNLRIKVGSIILGEFEIIAEFDDPDIIDSTLINVTLPDFIPTGRYAVEIEDLDTRRCDRFSDAVEIMETYVNANPLLIGFELDIWEDLPMSPQRITLLD